jgi:hypothetical protein
MSRAKTIVIAVTVFVFLVGMMTPSVDAQLVGSETGLVPGQPFVLSITSRGGAPLMVVYVGRVPLSSDSRVRLMLPDLGDDGLIYSLTTTGTVGTQRDRPIDRPYSDMGKRSQASTVGRIQCCLAQPQVTPSLGTPGGSMVSGGDSSGSGMTMGSGSGNSGGGTENSTVGDDNGSRRRAIRLLVPQRRWHSTDTGVLDHAHSRGVLDYDGERVHTFDSGGVGPLEAGAGSGSSQAGLDLAGSAPRRGLGAARAAGSLQDRPIRPDPDETGPRPIRSIPFPGNAHVTPGGILGTGGVVIIIDDQGLEFEGSAG